MNEKVTNKEITESELYIRAKEIRKMLEERATDPKIKIRAEKLHKKLTTISEETMTREFTI